MQPIQNFSLVPKVTAERIASELWFADRKVLEEIPGQTLEAQFELTLPEDHTASSFLLLTSDDVPYEEVLHILLLDAHGKILEQTELGNYRPGILKDVRVLGPHTIGFDFQGPVELTIQERRGWRRGRLQLDRQIS